MIDISAASITLKRISLIVLYIERLVKVNDHM